MHKSQKQHQEAPSLGETILHQKMKIKINQRVKEWQRPEAVCSHVLFGSAETVCRE